MTDAEWARGMAELIAQPWPSFGDDTPERKAIRGATYRRSLDGLSGELWLATVRMAVERERRFPPVALLLEYASEAASAYPSARSLPADTRTLEEKRADARKGLDLFRAELKRLGIEVPDELPVKDMPQP